MYKKYQITFLFWLFVLYVLLPYNMGNSSFKRINKLYLLLEIIAAPHSSNMNQSLTKSSRISYLDLLLTSQLHFYILNHQK